MPADRAHRMCAIGRHVRISCRRGSGMGPSPGLSGPVVLVSTPADPDGRRHHVQQAFHAPSSTCCSSPPRPWKAMAPSSGNHHVVVSGESASAVVADERAEDLAVPQALALAVARRRGSAVRSCAARTDASRSPAAAGAGLARTYRSCPPLDGQDPLPAPADLSSWARPTGRPPVQAELAGMVATSIGNGESCYSYLPISGSGPDVQAPIGPH